jgi:hypothetical protein
MRGQARLDIAGRVSGVDLVGLRRIHLALHHRRVGERDPPDMRDAGSRRSRARCRSPQAPPGRLPPGSRRTSSASRRRVQPACSTFPAMAPRFPELQEAGWLRQKYEVEGLSSYSIAAELGCRATTVSRALRRHGIAARMGRPAVIVPGQVYGRLIVLGELPERSKGGRVFRCLCACGRETEARAVGLRQRKVHSCGCPRDETRPGNPPGRRGYRADSATDGSSCWGSQRVRAQARPGCSAVAATAAARPPFAAPTSPAATLGRARACSRSTANAPAGRAQRSVPAEDRGC